MMKRLYKVIFLTHCDKCGKLLHRSDNFCDKCGASQHGKAFTAVTSRFTEIKNGIRSRLHFIGKKPSYNVSTGAKID